MLTGKRFTLSKSIMALDAVDKGSWVTVPAGAVIEVKSGPHGEGRRLVEVLWEDRPLKFLANDLTEAGIEIKEPKSART
ncbi:MAG: hypothetical protein LAO55_26145 [Acidobacteriia bacterium]|nr:hypothetical protein [Terriglobia bacterium]